MPKLEGYAVHLLNSVNSPADLKGLSPEQVSDLLQEIRHFLVESVSKTGGHLGPNLGVVELTVALHRVFSAPDDAIIFDTGHQSYVHKLLTGRQDFSGLKKTGGISGYPSRRESAYDIVENSHASTSLSWAEGIAHAYKASGSQNQAVAVIGDGAMTGGMAWEALNNIAAHDDLPLVIVLNDNRRSYARTIGGLANHLASLRTTNSYEQVLGWGKQAITSTPVVGKLAYDTLHGIKRGIADFVYPDTGLFQELGLKYLGPVDGHDEAALEEAFSYARDFSGPVIVHVITRKGEGYEPAMADSADHWHGIGKFNPETGLPFEVNGPIWTDEFSAELVALGQERSDLVAITAAMLIPVGLEAFQAAFPDRVFDVGIAEQHAITMAAGLSYGGLHPVVAVYATFLNRAFDQLLFDAALHKQRMTIVLDRAGVTGSDGPSHNGMWDMTMAGIIPGLFVNAPRDGQSVRTALRESVEISTGPSIIRFPKGDVGPAIKAVRRVGAVEVLSEKDDQPVDVLLIGVGIMTVLALKVAKQLAQAGYRVRVIDPRWVLPVSSEVLEFTAEADYVAIIEDNLVDGGIGASITAAMQKNHQRQTVDTFGLPKEFLPHGSRADVLQYAGLTSEQVFATISQTLESN